MRALVVRRPNGPELIDVPAPEPGPGQVRVAVAAAAVNPVDLAVAGGLAVELGLAAPRDRSGLGWDVAGTVDAVGAGVGIGIGTPVIGLSDMLVRPLKTHADQVVLDADAVVRAPQGLDHVAASTVALNALTAYQALAALDLRPGQTLLVTGAAGGVGGYAVELARHRGITVVAVAGDDDEPMVRGFGADLFVPRSVDLPTRIRELVPGGVDAVVDAAVLGMRAQEAVRDSGGVVHLVGGTAPPALRGIRLTQVFVEARSAELAELVGLVESGVLSTRVAETFPLDDAPAAYARLAKGGVRGRIVLTP